MNKTTTRPHVLFIIMHDFGPRYGCYDDPVAVTPNLDRIAAEGMRFENHFCNYPLCGPARANLFTGFRPEVTRRFNNKPFFEAFRKRQGDDFATLPQWFRFHGYRSVGTGFIYHDRPDAPSWSEPYKPQVLPDDLPQWSLPYQTACPNIYRSNDSLDLIKKRADDLIAQGYDADRLFSLEGLRQCRGPAVESGDCSDEAYYDGVTAGNALDWISVHDPGVPLFCAVGFTATHLPFNVPEKYWNLYDREELSLASYGESPQGAPEWVEGDSEPVQYYTTNGYSLPWRASEEESLELKHGHYAAISYIDAQIGRLLAALDAKKMLDDTIVVVTSDHGFHDSEHGYWGKHNCWDHSFQVPLLMRVPGTDSGRFSGLSEHVDVYPTLCTAAGLPVPGFCHGQDLFGSFAVGRFPDRTAVYGMRKPMWHDRLQVYEQCRSVRTERYRLNTYLDTDGEVLYRELFDYEQDPEERVNLAPKEPSLIEELEQMYQRNVIEAGSKNE